MPSQNKKSGRKPSVRKKAERTNATEHKRKFCRNSAANRRSRAKEHEKEKNLSNESWTKSQKNEDSLLREVEIYGKITIVNRT